MKMAEELQRELCSINRKSYPAYKGLKGAYQFPDYQLFIEHVQGDPFAAPSALRIFVPHSKAKFPERYYWDKCSKVALQDALLRRFAEISAKFCYQAKGSGKSRSVTADRKFWSELPVRSQRKASTSAFLSVFRQMDERSIPANWKRFCLCIFRSAWKCLCITEKFWKERPSR